jgi:hypothetical protein
MSRAIIVFGAGIFLASFAPSLVAQQSTPQPSAAAIETYKPKLADIMLMLQARHAKLSLAGEAANWPLAEFQLEELEEALDDAQKHHPTFKEVPVKEMIQSIAMPAVAEVKKAITARNRTAFAGAFRELTSACNNCHQAANRGFFVIQRPATSPYPNQSFAPGRN